MLDSAGKRVAEQGQLQFLAERRERLDIPDGCRQRMCILNVHTVWIAVTASYVSSIGDYILWKVQLHDHAEKMVTFTKTRK